MDQAASRSPTRGTERLRATLTEVAEVAASGISHKPDVAFTAAAGIVALVFDVMKLSVGRFFVERDPALSFPVVSSTVPTSLLILLAVALPSASLAAALHRGVFGDRVQHGTVQLSFYLALAVQWLLVNITKSLCGRLRPNFFALCDYKGYAKALEFATLDEGASQAMAAYLDITRPGAVGNVRYCSHDEGQGHLSFPSGHTSTAFAGLGFLGLTAATAVRAVNVPLPTQAAALFCPLLVAGWIGCTRVQDYWHNTDDVLGGAVIGSLCAWWAFQTRLAPLLAVEQRLSRHGREIELSGTP